MFVLKLTNMSNSPEVVGRGSEKQFPVGEKMNKITQWVKA